MKSIIIVLTITFCVSVVSCTNNPKQQNTIIGGTDGTTEMVINEKDCKDTVTNCKTVCFGTQSSYPKNTKAKKLVCGLNMKIIGKMYKSSMCLWQILQMLGGYSDVVGI